MRTLATLPPLFLTGCIFGGNDTVGHWEGDCFIDSFGTEATYAIVLDIDSEEKKELVGSSLVDLTGGFSDPAPVDMVGTRKGKNVEFELLLDSLYDDTDFSLTFRGEAKLKGDDLVGDCFVGAMGFAIRGDLDLVR